ncbi:MULTISPECIES: NADPH:quinone reductase [unclassified Modestobacter]|uniref:NADPH:quinone reductase n=1 Tax=unclassified Modestobacter TaxID=2643866 RepID=UPI0022AA32A7|nr:MULTISPECIES: NADPH:quinone reductase [unclassified Modestobacter]MCZ2824451.1 NADPH:quinone reductase [Modestobacter sp. VKM Ac-2981]MCZ2854021.1 NADPH:quinone reductase [Modestobacter sp. VKM Ac-2982]
MRAITYTQPGGPDVLQLVDRPTPDPGPGEVRVRLAFSGVNPTDWKSRSTAQPGPDGQVPNQDGAGTIDAVGEGVDPVLVGERVWIWEAAWQRPHGTAAEYTVVPARQTVLLGADPSFELGAALGIPFLTAHRCLTIAESLPDRLSPGSLNGRTVLVQGGAGAVGNAAVQLARWAEATVIATVSSPMKAQLAARAGADHVIDYTSQDVVAEVRKIAPNGVDSIVEVSAAQNAAVDAQLVAMHGAVAMYADDGGAEVTVPVRSQMVPNARWQFVLVYTEPTRAKDIAVGDVNAAVLDGAIRVGEDAGLPLHVHPLAETAAAHQAVQDGAVGKVLIDVTA